MERSKDYQERYIAVFIMYGDGEESGKSIRAHPLLSRDGKTELPVLTLHNIASFLGSWFFLKTKLLILLDRSDVAIYGSSGAICKEKHTTHINTEHAFEYWRW